MVYGLGLLAGSEREKNHVTCDKSRPLIEDFMKLVTIAVFLKILRTFCQWPQILVLSLIFKYGLFLSGRIS